MVLYSLLPVVIFWFVCLFAEDFLSARGGKKFSTGGKSERNIKCKIEPSSPKNTQERIQKTPVETQHAAAFVVYNTKLLRVNEQVTAEQQAEDVAKLFEKTV